MPKRRRTTGKRSYGSKRRKTGARRRFSFKTRRYKKRMGRPSYTRIKGLSANDGLKVKLVYSQLVVFTSTAGAVQQQTYRGNSLFDPDVGAAAGQPYYMDQYSLLYQGYIVSGSSIRVEFWNQPDATVAAASLVGEMTVVPTTDLTGFTGANQTLMQEQKYASTTRGQLFVRPRVIKKYMSTAKVVGLSPTTIQGDPNFRAAVTGNPTSQWYWQVGYNSMDATNTTSVIARVRIVYYVKFFNRQVPALS